MTSSGRALVVTVLALAAATACGPAGETDAAELMVTADTTDPALLEPGAVFRFGPATPEEMAGPVYPPVVRGDEGQVSIYEGYFVQAPCARPLRIDASRAGDTIVVRILSDPDTLRADACEGEERALGYAALVGQFEPGRYAVRVIHEGDRARPAPLDTVYDDITVKPNRR